MYSESDVVQDFERVGEVWEEGEGWVWGGVNLEAEGGMTEYSSANQKAAQWTF